MEYTVPHGSRNTPAALRANESPTRAGWSIPVFCEACGFSRASYYNLPAELQPKSVKLGKRRIVIEAPAVYLARVAAAQDAA